MTDSQIITAWCGKEIDPLDPAAWGPELWEAIERAGLKDRFKAALHEVLAKDYADAPQHVSVWEWRVIKSTPEQKARALSMAIKEVER